MNDIEQTLAAAAIVHAGKGAADESLLNFAHRMQAQGHTVRGLVPGPLSDINNCNTRTVRDLEDGTIYPIGQSLGKESRACCLDPGALLEAGVVLRRAIDSNPDLVIINRFGILEADGEGFSAEMLELMSQGTPMLTVVSHPYLNAWRRFTGGMATELPPDADMALNWFNGLPRYP